MTTIKKSKELIREQLQNCNSVVAIFQNGSSIVGMDTKNSDIDYVVIVKNPEDIKDTISEIREVFGRVEIEKDTSMYTCAGYFGMDTKVDCSFFWEKQFEDYVASFCDNTEQFIALQHMIQHKIIDAVPVIDSKGLLAKYRSKVEAGIEKNWEKVFNYSIQTAEENIQEWELYGFRNEFQFGYVVWEVITLLVQALYMRNKKLYMLPFKRLHKDVKFLKPDIQKELYSLLKNYNTKEVIVKKIGIIKNIIQLLKST